MAFSTLQRRASFKHTPFSVSPTTVFDHHPCRKTCIGRPSEAIFTLILWILSASLQHRSEIKDIATEKTYRVDGKHSLLMNQRCHQWSLFFLTNFGGVVFPFKRSLWSFPWAFFKWHQELQGKFSSKFCGTFYQIPSQRRGSSRKTLQNCQTDWYPRCNFQVIPDLHGG